MATAVSTNRIECISRVLGAHGFTTFTTEETSEAGLVHLGGALANAEQHLLTPVEQPRWGEIAEILRSLSSAVEAVAVHCHDPSTLALVFIRTAPAFDLAASHNFVEATGEWLAAIRERTTEFELGEQAKGLAEQAIGAVSANPLLAGAAKLVLDCARFRGAVRAVTVENYAGFTEESLKSWRSADLTVVTTGIWSQIWAWDHRPAIADSEGNIHRGGGSEWGDAQNQDFLPEIKSASALWRSVQSLCPPGT